MLGLGVSLGRGGAPQKEPYKEYASDFSSGVDGWGSAVADPVITPTAPTTLDGVDDALVYTVDDDTQFIAIKSNEINAGDSNNTIQVTADLYIESTSSNGQLVHTAGAYSTNLTTVTVPLNAWTTVSFTKQLGEVTGSTLGFRTISTALSVGDKLGIKNYVVKFYD